MRRFDELYAYIYRKDLITLGAMLGSNPSVNIRDADGRTLLMHAVLAEEASLMVVKFLIERGVDVNAVDSDQQWTALHFAARDQNRDIVKTLLESGAHPEPLDTFGNTPLWRAVMNRAPDLELVRLLMDFGADPRRKNNTGISPIDVARSMGRLDRAAMMEQPHVST